MPKRRSLKPAGAIVAFVALASTTTLARAAVICEIAAPSIDFGTFDGEAVEVEETIAVTCTGSGNNQDVTVDVSQGSSGNFSIRRMVGPQSQALDYNLYTTEAHAVVWGNGTGGTFHFFDMLDFRTEHTHVIELRVYGLLRSQPVPEGGRYIDTITVTVTS